MVVTVTDRMVVTTTADGGHSDRSYELSRTLRLNSHIRGSDFWRSRTAEGINIELSEDLEEQRVMEAVAS